MESLFAKIRLFGLSTAHSVIDKALDMNSIPALEQRIRDLESARKDVESSLSGANFDYQTAQSKYDANSQTEARLADEVRTLMGANGGQPDEAQKSEANRKVDAIRQSRDAHQSEADRLARLKQNAEKMRSAAQELVAAETRIKARIQELKTTEASTRNLNRGTKAFEGANNAVNALDGIDSAAEKINRDNNAATDRFDRAMGAMTSASQPSEVDKLQNADIMSEILGKGGQQAA